MGKRIKITEQQLSLIVEHVKNGNVNKVVLRNQVIEEGFKEILLGTALLLNLNLSGQSSVKAKQQLNDETAMKQLNDVLNNDSLRSKVVDYFEKKGLKDIDEKIIKNNKELTKALESGKHAKTTHTVSTASGIKGQLGQGRGLVSMEEITDEDAKSIEKIDSVIVFDFSSDNSFVTGSYELNNEVKSKIQAMIDDLSSSPNVTVNSVKITSSTDTEPIRRYVTSDDSTGNVKLSNLRVNSIANMFTGVVDSAKIKTNALPNEGPDIYRRDMSPSERDSARKETQQYRYVTVELDITVTPGGEEDPDKLEEVKYVCTFINVHTGGSKVVKINRKKSKTNMHVKTPSGKPLEIIGAECPLF